MIEPGFSWLKAKTLPLNHLVPHQIDLTYYLLISDVKVGHSVSVIVTIMLVPNYALLTNDFHHRLYCFLMKALPH